MKNKYALHGMVPFYSNMLSDIRIAAQAGYNGLEAHTEKLWRYLMHGGNAKEINKHLALHNIEISGIGIIGDIENTTITSINRMEEEAEILSAFAQVVKAPVIQLNAFEALNGLATKDIIRITAKNIQRIVDIGKNYNIKFQYEGAAWTPIHTLADCLALVEEVARDNFGLVIDFWHFWASYGASPDDIAKLDASIIYTVHVTDGYRPKKNAPWKDQKVYRCALPGEGKLPVKEWVDAVTSTGYTGYFSGEILNDRLWEHDAIELSQNMYKAIRTFI